MLTKFRNKDGFTLIELIAIMVILSVWSAVIVKKVVAVSNSSERNALMQGIVELNTRESLTWFNIKMSNTGYESDEKIWEKIDTNIGIEYIWTSGPTRSGGELQFGSQSFVLPRNESTKESPASWTP
jgi:prepilin-type N-terminal cleavage/methylation domain-containing protein